MTDTTPDVPPDVPHPITADDLDKIRAECAQEWIDQAGADWKLTMLRGGPLDGKAAPREAGAQSWTGAWVDSSGDVVRLTYEWVKDGETWWGEFAGKSNTTEIANEIAAAEFADERKKLDTTEPVDLESMSVDEALEFLALDNERRITELLEASGGQVDLTNAFDLLYVKCFVNRILLFMSPKIHTEASLDYEDRRSQLLDEVQDKYEKFQNEREAAMARARLSLDQMPPGAVPPGPPMTMPSRRIRRAKK